LEKKQVEEEEGGEGAETKKQTNEQGTK